MKQFPRRQYFPNNHNSALIFVELTRLGFSRGSRVQWPTVNEQFFKLGGAINYVDPMADFLGGNEPIRTPIENKQSSLKVSSLSTVI